MVTNGSDMMLFVSGSSIACATSHKLTINAETAETSSKDVSGGWSAESIKKLSWEASTENLFSTDGEGKSFDDLFALMIAKTPIDAAFSLSKDTADATKTEAPDGGWTLSTTGIYKGKVIITSLELNAPNGDNATYSATFKGVGELKKIAEV